MASPWPQFHCCSSPAAVRARSEVARTIATRPIPRTSCILAEVESILTGIDEHQTWTPVAIEFALALSSDGKQREALLVLAAAADRLERIDTDDQTATLLAELASVYHQIGEAPEVATAVAAGMALVQSLDSESKRLDLYAKFAVATAYAGQAEQAQVLLSEFPEPTDAALNSYLARGMRELAAHQAAMGDFDAALETLASITMGLTYYRAIAGTDIASHAFDADRATLAFRLLGDAESVARAQENGYFRAGALRDIGAAYIRGTGNSDRAFEFYASAQEAALDAPSYQERARALSRIGTKMADDRLFAEAARLLPDAIALAEQEENEAMRNYAYYEIVGSAAFVGAFDVARPIVPNLPSDPFGSATSLRAAAERDVAWGMARHGQLSDALEVARSISPARERSQALCRIVRLLNDPDMKALPRYL